MRSIKNRIYIQNGIIIMVIVLILESIFLLVVRNYYFQSVEQELLNKAEISGAFYNKYLIEDPIGEKARYILENDSKDKHIYMQVFNNKKIMLTDSNGVSSDKAIKASDIDSVLDGKSEIVIKKNNDESSIAVSVPLYDNVKNISGVLRYVTSVEDVEKMVLNILWISILIGISVIIITFLFSSFLAKGIVSPIKELTNIAETMAKGDFTKRAVKRNNDEVGKLSDTLNYMTEEIVKSNAVKNEFISSVSHELRTPLTAIRGWSEIILTGEIENFEEAKEGIKIIASETDRLSGLVEELLDFSKFESGRITLNLEKLDLNDLVNEVCYYFKNRFEEKGIKLNLNTNNKLCTVVGDINRLKQVLINIIDNAIKFSKQNGKIQVNVNRKSNSVLIEVIDNGIGIPKEDIHNVTEKFYKGKSKQSGSGIGLAICNEIIEMHGGRLHIESEENKGTNVTIEILTDL